LTAIGDSSVGVLFCLLILLLFGIGVTARLTALPAVEGQQGLLWRSFGRGWAAAAGGATAGGAAAAVRIAFLLLFFRVGVVRGVEKVLLKERRKPN